MPEMKSLKLTCSHEGWWIHFCVDYHKLNINKADTYPVSCIKDALDCLLIEVIFATLGFMSGYWQIHKREKDIEMTFTCPEGLFEFTQMPLGLKQCSRGLSISS